ncbi:MAG: FeoB-associated Cys-rich membrane protein [Endomicrobia bacterium]|nr:FeoB-associated Cys-rich membrane protein [Endomicrobiia bacterium]
MQNIIVILIVAAAVFFLIRYFIKGKRCCGCSGNKSDKICGGCFFKDTK